MPELPGSPNRKKDDRYLAPGWYLRMLIQNRLREEPDLTHTAIAKAAGIARQNITYIIQDGQVVGMKVLIGLADYLGIAAGDIINRGLAWWEKEGRADYARELESQAVAARPSDGSGSGEHASARSLAVGRKLP